MKATIKIIMVILFSLITLKSNAQVGQNYSPALEIFMKTKMTNGATVKFKATANTTPIWNPLTYLIDTQNWLTKTLEINGDYNGYEVGWHTDGGTQYGMPSLGWCKEYTIKVTNADKYASFKVETYGWQHVSDIYIMYDYSTDHFATWSGDELDPIIMI